MQVTNSTNFTTQQPAKLGGTSSVQAQELRTKALAREALSQEDSKAKTSQSDVESRQRLDIDDQAIALIEREQLQPYNNGGNQKKAEQNNSVNSGYDTPSSQNQTAVAAYQSVDSIAQRDNIQQVFGVDLFV